MAHLRPQFHGPPTRRRRAHRKSRQGCTECKTRHIKCDEQRPSCANCVSSERLCSLRPNVLSTKTPTSCRDAIHEAYTTTTEEQEVNVRFTAIHLACLHHAETYMEEYMALKDSSQPIIEMALAAAETAPFLLDQVLALSALHLSSETSPKQSVYHHEATKLQIRALGFFKQFKEMESDTNRLSLFVFASLLGIHVLKETLASNPETISAFVEKFVSYLHLHRGVRTFIDEESWQQVLQSDLGTLLHLSHLSQAIEDQMPGTETHRLRAFLAIYDSGSEITDACQSALRWIQWMIDLSKQDLSDESLGIHAILAWPHVIPEDYITALRQHRPEALAVLAFYAAALRQYRQFWVFENSGSLILRLITSSIGSFWLEHLDLPGGNLSGSNTNSKR